MLVFDTADLLHLSPFPRGTSPGEIVIILFSNSFATGTEGVCTTHPAIAYNLINEYTKRDKFRQTVFIPFLEYKKNLLNPGYFLLLNHLKINLENRNAVQFFKIIFQEASRF